MKIVFLGTPAFADVSLKRLLKSRHRIVGVVTQPDRPKGRSKQPAPPPIKETARGAGIPCLQPENLKEPSFLIQLKSWSAELAVVVAYGRILPSSVIRAFQKGAINLHASLLPKFRGAAPIQWALIRGETETGVTIFQLDEQLDHGPILYQTLHPIRPEDTAVTLSESLAKIGAEALVKTLDLLETGSIRPKPQDESHISAAPRLTKQEGIIDWKLGCQEIHNRVRGLQPWPGAITHLTGQPIKLVATHPDPKRHDSEITSGAASSSRSHDPALAPGAVALADPVQGLWIQTGQGQLRIDRLQPAGGTPLDTAAFLRGHPIPAGTILT
ncbi:MAG: methionyl-tRNA formyltransferase [Candidatus Omnitrophica bacterium]|nr:methionyl-tRNA formyltransferase [Candidatus Omnitrophota bacterium]